MIPIRDTIPCTHRPYVTWGLIAVNTSIFLYSLSLSDKTLYELFHLYGLVPARFTHPEWAAQRGYPAGYWPFLSNMFLHSGWLHIVMNMWLLWIFADNVEDHMGPGRFLLFYGMCGLVAASVHQYTNSESVIPAVGASGAIAGVLGAYFFLFPYARIVVWIPLLFLPIFVEVPAIAFVGIWVIFQLYNLTSTLAETQAGDVAWWGHLGGFMAGAAFYPLFFRSTANDRADDTARSE